MNFVMRHSAVMQDSGVVLTDQLLRSPDAQVHGSGLGLTKMKSSKLNEKSIKHVQWSLTMRSNEYMAHAQPDAAGMPGAGIVKQIGVHRP